MEEDSLGADDPEVARTLNNRANLLVQQVIHLDVRRRVSERGSRKKHIGLKQAQL